jgi:hypothetical protein
VQRLRIGPTKRSADSIAVDNLDMFISIFTEALTAGACFVVPLPSIAYYLVPFPLFLTTGIQYIIPTGVLLDSLMKEQLLCCFASTAST